MATQRWVAISVNTTERNAAMAIPSDDREATEASQSAEGRIREGAAR
jgi:hypothetical protein